MKGRVRRRPGNWLSWSAQCQGHKKEGKRKNIDVVVHSFREAEEAHLCKFQAGLVSAASSRSSKRHSETQSQKREKETLAQTR